MKLMKLLLIMTPLLFSITSVKAEALIDCTEKQQKIEAQLEQAQIRAIPYEIQGLANALKETMANCTDKNLKVKKGQKTQEKVDQLIEKQKKVDRLKIEIKQEMRFGNHNQILKKQEKLKKALIELNEVKKQL